MNEAKLPLPEIKPVAVFVDRGQVITQEFISHDGRVLAGYRAIPEAAGFPAWEQRGKEARELAGVHHLYDDAVHDAYVRALRYGFAEDFTFLVKKAHPRVGGKDVSILRPQWSTGGKEDPSFVEEN